MIIIGLDLSTTSTGVAVYNDGFFCKLETITGSRDTMVQRIEDIVRHQHNIDNRVVVVTELFTSSMGVNDRTGSYINIESLKNQITKMCEVVGVFVAYFTPWAWRRYFNLPTRVIPPNNTPKQHQLARVLGHDILKQQSLKYVIDNAKVLGLHTNECITNDEAESVLLVSAYIRSCGKLNDTATYFNNYVLSESDVQWGWNNG